MKYCLTSGLTLAGALMLICAATGCGQAAPPTTDSSLNVLPEQIVTPAERDPFAAPGVINTPSEVRPGLAEDR